MKNIIKVLVVICALMIPSTASARPILQSLSVARGATAVERFLASTEPTSPEWQHVKLDACWKVNKTAVYCSFKYPGKEERQNGELPYEFHAVAELHVQRQYILGKEAGEPSKIPYTEQP